MARTASVIGSLKFVTLHQHCEEAGDEAGAEIAGALKDLRKQMKDGRGVAFLAGRLARGQTDLALGHRQPSH